MSMCRPSIQVIFPLLFPGHFQGVGSEVDHLGLELVAVWDAGIAGTGLHVRPQYWPHLCIF